MADSIVGRPVWPNYSSRNTPSPTEQNNVMGKDAFLKILITQLQNQDPSSPMQDREFIAQMAQFTTLEQMVNMTEEIKGLRQSLGIASGLIGMEATWLTYDSEGKIAGEETGIVDSITVKDGLQYAGVGSQAILFDHIIAVRALSGDGTDE